MTSTRFAAVFSTVLAALVVAEWCAVMPVPTYVSILAGLLVWIICFLLAKDTLDT